MVAEELWSAMHGVAAAAKHDKIPGGLNEFGKIANRSLELWRKDPASMKKFALRVLDGPADLRKALSQLPEKTATACWRLLDLLQYVGATELRT